MCRTGDVLSFSFLHGRRTEEAATPPLPRRAIAGILGKGWKRCLVPNMGPGRDGYLQA